MDGHSYHYDDMDHYDFDPSVLKTSARVLSQSLPRMREPNVLFTAKLEEPQPVPDDLQNILVHSKQPAEEISKLFPVVLESLTPENYGEKQHLLLFMEEFERSSWRKITLRRSSISSRCKIQSGKESLRPRQNMFMVKWPSGYEASPTPLTVKSGDPCRFFYRNAYTDGKITATNDLGIFLTPDIDLEDEIIEQVLLYFPKRNPFFRTLHQAMDKYCTRLGKAGFPDLKTSLKFAQVYANFIDQPDLNINTEICRDAAELLNRKIDIKKISKRNHILLPEFRLQFYNPELNYRQKCAVEEIVIGAHRPNPYIIFGFPGTGKTMTLVEAVIQLVLKCPTSRIVVSAPTDSAVDMLLQFLITSKEADTVWRAGGWIKLVDGSQRSSSLSPFIRSVTEPNLLERIVFMTCSVAGRVPEYHRVVFDKFTHVFVDEAGSAMEAEVMLPILLLHVRGDMQIVIAGDVFQMRPKVASHLACQFGLETSLLSRLLCRPPYQRSMANLEIDDNFDRRNITSLVHHYRCAPKILEISNKIFYDNKLIFRTKDAVKYRGLPPVIFCSVDGREMTDSRNSKFNYEEASLVIKYVKKLYFFGIAAKDIVIIAAHQAQVRQIMQLFATSGQKEVYIPALRTVDQFVGCERSVVIISVVETELQSKSGDGNRSQEGFVGFPDRVNVGVSRALDHLCLIGNSSSLLQDLFFKELINFCRVSGTYYDEDRLLS